MKVLVIGSGGREHALAWRIAASERVEAVICAPGNAGTALVAENVDVQSQDQDGLVALAAGRAVDLVVVGPEAPLAAGLGDKFEARGIPICGPDALCSTLESSKSVAKLLMAKAGVATARWELFDDARIARQYVEHIGAPIVVKADGLAAGKGVVVAKTVGEALQAVDDILAHRRFGDAGKRIVIEEYLSGEEVSYMVLTDGETVLPLATSKDHKRLLDRNRGPNTGGMGAISPAPSLSGALAEHLHDLVVIPMIRMLAAQGTPYRGFLYTGVMLTSDGPKVLEFNCRLGDPETQPLVVRMAGDPVPALLAAATHSLAGHAIEWKRQASACVVMASGGYPNDYARDYPISGLEAAADHPGVTVFHAGTKRDADGTLRTDGGRVLGVTALGDGLSHAVAKAYAAVREIHWQDEHHRSDIGRTNGAREG